MINSQLVGERGQLQPSISKGMGDQFSALMPNAALKLQYIKGDG